MTKIMFIALSLAGFILACKVPEEASDLASTSSAGQNFLLNLRPTPQNAMMQTSPQIPQIPQIPAIGNDNSSSTETGYNVVLESDKFRGPVNDLFIAQQGGLLFSRTSGVQERLYMIIYPESRNHGLLFTKDKIIWPSTAAELNLVLNVARVIMQNNLLADPTEGVKAQLFLQTYFKVQLGTNNSIPNNLMNNQPYPNPQTTPLAQSIGSQPTSNPFAAPQNQGLYGQNPGASMQPNNLPANGLNTINQANPMNGNVDQFGNPIDSNSNPNNIISANNPSTVTPNPNLGQPGAAVSPVTVDARTLAAYIRFPGEFTAVNATTLQHPSYGTVQINAMLAQFKNGIDVNLIVPEPQDSGPNTNTNPGNTPNPNQPQNSTMNTAQIIDIGSEAQHDQVMQQAASGGIKRALLMVGNPSGCPPCQALHEEVQTNLAGKDNTLYLEVDHQQVIQSSSKLSQKYTGVSNYPHVFIVDPSTGAVVKEFPGRGKSASDLQAAIQGS